MKNKAIKFGFLLAIYLSLPGGSNADAARAASFENDYFSAADNRCRVTERTSIFINSLNQNYVLNAGTRLLVVDSEPHQGFIVVKMKIHGKWRRGEIKYEDTNCV